MKWKRQDLEWRTGPAEEMDKMEKNGEIWVKVYFAYNVIMRLWAQYSESKGSYNEVYHKYVLAKHKTAFIVQKFCRCIYFTMI